MDLYKYLKHLPECNKMKDWFEAQDALSHGPDDEGTAIAWKDLRIKMKTCTCGLEKTLKEFTEKTYSAGFDAGNI